MRSEAASTAGHGPRRVGGTAVVIGASMAGLCAACVLSARFDRVVVVERDALPDAAAPRRLVPQGRHPHLLLVAGARLLEGWLPGLLDDLRAEGAIGLDLCADFLWHQGGGFQRRPASTLCGPAMSRPLLEWTVRRRVTARDNVELRDDTAVEGVLTDRARTRVTGVRAGGEDVRGDLVVDASGRPARTLGWLAELGYEPPPTSVVEVDTRYVSRAYVRTNDPGRDWKAVAVIGDPESKRLAMALPMEGDRWIVLIAGLNGESAPTDDGATLAYARTLGCPVIADIIATSTPLGEPAVHRFPANERRHVERLRRFPLGWVLLGDAVCSFNPIYGQGMTSAAQQAAALGATLDRVGRIDRSFARRYFRAASRVVRTPWSIAVGGDFAYDGTKGEKPLGTDVLNRYMDRVIAAGQRDDRVVTRFNEVASLVCDPQALLAPAFMLRVLRASRHTGAPGGARNASPATTTSGRERGRSVVRRTPCR